MKYVSPLLTLLATLLAILLVTVPTQGCALLLTGYLVGDYQANQKRTAECRENLRITNEARVAKNQDPFPDMCAR
jgi:hypothetical protein